MDILYNGFTNAIEYISSSPIGSLIAIDFGIQWTGFIIAKVLHTEKFYDVTGNVRDTNNKK